MFDQTTFADSPNAISLPELQSGHTRFNSPVGLMIDLFGPVPVRANLSARQAKALGLLTSGICGLRGNGSLASAALQSSLESKLRVRLSGLGSTLYTLTWKRWATPMGVSRSRLRASVRRTSETGTSGWPTPTAALAEKGVRTFGGGLIEAMRNHGPDLAAAACLAGWPTPSATIVDAKPRPPITSGRKPTDPQIGLADVAVHLAGWPTPMAGTPAQKGYNAAGNTDSSRKTVELSVLNQPARLTVSGELLTGCSAGMMGRDGAVKEPAAEIPRKDQGSRAGRLRGYGNAINAQAASEFIRAAREAIDLTA